MSGTGLGRDEDEMQFLHSRKSQSRPENGGPTGKQQKINSCKYNHNINNKSVMPVILVFKDTEFVTMIVILGNALSIA